MNYSSSRCFPHFFSSRAKNTSWACPLEFNLARQSMIAHTLFFMKLDSYFPMRKPIINISHFQYERSRLCGNPISIDVLLWPSDKSDKAIMYHFRSWYLSGNGHYEILVSFSEPTSTSASETSQNSIFLSLPESRLTQQANKCCSPSLSKHAPLSNNFSTCNKGAIKTHLCSRNMSSCPWTNQHYSIPWQSIHPKNDIAIFIFKLY